MFPNAQVTTSLVWICTGIVFLLDAALVILAWSLVSREHFRQMRWLLGIAGGVFFLGVWSSVMLWGWDWFYVYIFPGWGRYVLPPIFWIGYTMVALGMTWLSLKTPNPAVAWCVLGGVEGLLSHIFAIYGLGAASKPPIMQGSDPLAVLIFAVFEKAFYWSVILLVSWLVWKTMKRRASAQVLAKL